MESIKETAMRIMAETGGSKRDCEAYGAVAEFLSANPDMIARGGALDESFLKRRAKKFLEKRDNPGSMMPKTSPDPMIREALNEAFQVPANDLDKAVEYHR